MFFLRKTKVMFTANLADKTRTKPITYNHGGMSLVGGHTSGVRYTPPKTLTMDAYALQFQAAIEKFSIGEYITYESCKADNRFPLTIMKVEEFTPYLKHTMESEGVAKVLGVIFINPETMVPWTKHPLTTHLPLHQVRSLTAQEYEHVCKRIAELNRSKATQETT